MSEIKECQHIHASLYSFHLVTDNLVYCFQPHAHLVGTKMRSHIHVRTCSRYAKEHEQKLEAGHRQL